MLHPDKTTFLLIWPKCFIVFLGVVEFIAVLILFVAELCSVGANFWTTNVLGGFWCGLVVLIHAIALFVAGLCKPGPSAAFRAAIVTIVELIACALLISFNIAFVISPTICIMTPSCAQMASSTTSFSYSFRQSFFQTFNGLDGFKSYSESQAKLLFQYIELGLAALCFIIGIIYLVIYFECLRRLKKHQQVGPHTLNSPNYNTLRDGNVTPMSIGGRDPYSPAPVTPGNVYVNQPPQRYTTARQPPPPPPQYMTTRQPYMPNTQQMYGNPSAPPQMLYYPNAAPPAQPMYYAAPPPPPGTWRAPQMTRPARAAVRPWYAHQNN